MTTRYYQAVDDEKGERGFIKIEKNGSVTMHKFLVTARACDGKGFKPVASFTHWDDLLDKLGELPWERGPLSHSDRADVADVPALSPDSVLSGFALKGLEFLIADGDDPLTFRIHGPWPHNDDNLEIAHIIALALRRVPQPKYAELDDLLHKYVPSFQCRGWDWEESDGSEEGEGEDSDKPKVKKAHLRAQKIAEAIRLQRESVRLLREAASDNDSDSEED